MNRKAEIKAEITERARIIQLEFMEAGFNLEEWRDNLRPGDVAFVAGRVCNGPVAILEWENCKMFPSIREKDHFCVVHGNQKAYVLRKNIYPRRPACVTDDEMIFEG